MTPISWRNVRQAVTPPAFAYHVDQTLDAMRDLTVYGDPCVLVTMGGDTPITKWHADLLPDNVAMWFAQNAHVEHPRITGIPIGVPSDETYGDFEVIRRHMGTPKTKRLFACFCVGNNVPERAAALQAAYREGTTIIPFVKNEEKALPHEAFIRLMAQHEYVLSPPGAQDSDAHRTWEALYLGCIPICKRSQALSYFEDLPILFVDDWSELNDDLLNDAYSRLHPRFSDEAVMQKLWLPWWIERIKGVLA